VKTRTPAHPPSNRLAVAVGTLIGRENSTHGSGFAPDGLNPSFPGRERRRRGGRRRLRL